ncbi:MAG: ribonuclease HII [Ignavibacteria bacterium]|nr:ribonuclease HII [Ignavibacteria bacterium]
MLPPLTLETERKHLAGSRLVVGVDEAGRGALAGPVVAAAVVLNTKIEIPDLIKDSKQLSPGARQTMAEWIYSNALFVSLGIVQNDRIDEVNILQATYDAMHQAINGLKLGNNKRPYLLIDGNRFRKHVYEHECIVKGDTLIASIAAASIIAKTHRDGLMSDQENLRFPQYLFHKHKGYGTRKHRELIIEHGVCSIHRRTFLRNILPPSAL